MKEYIVDKQGKRREAVRVICENCGKEFLKPKRFLTRNKHHFCSQKCSHNFQQNRIKLKCAFCEKEFYRTPSKMIGSKSGIYFCCRKCKDEAQKIGMVLKVFNHLIMVMVHHLMYIKEFVLNIILISVVYVVKKI